MKKKARLLGTLSVITALGILVGCNNAKEVDTVTEEREVPVLVEPVTFGALSDSNLFTGTIEAENEVNVVPQAAGELTKVMVKKGDAVKQGAVLAQIDDTAERNAVQQQEAALKQAQAGLQTAQNGQTKAEQGYKQAQASLRQTEASLAEARKSKNDNLDNIEFQIKNAQIAWEQTKDNLTRMKALYDDGLISKKDYEDAANAEKNAKNQLDQVKLNKEQAGSDVGLRSLEAAVEQARIGVDLANASSRDAQIGVTQAQASVEQAQLAVDSARDRLDDKVIVATISGEVTDVMGEVGEMASSQAPFATIVSFNKVKVSVNILPEQLSSFKVGDQVNVEVSGIEEPFKAKVSYVSAISSGSGLFTVEAEIDNKPKQIRPGMVASIVIDEVLEDDSLLIPTTAVIQREGKSVVFVVTDGTAVQKDVEVVRYGTDTTAVTGDLKENDQVVISGQNLLEDGNLVEIMEED